MALGIGKRQEEIDLRLRLLAHLPVFAGSHLQPQAEDRPPDTIDDFGGGAVHQKGKDRHKNAGPIQDPKLASVPAEAAKIYPSTRLVYFTEPHSAGADRFRLLRMRLREYQSAKQVKSILLTSALPHDGKSTTALNLATALSEHGAKSVLLLEADLHRPTLVEQLGVNHGPGLSDCLMHRTDPTSAIRRIEPLGWYLLQAGSTPDNPTELLQSETLSTLMRSLSTLFDWIVIDSPPVVPLADTLALAKSVDASLLVVKAGHTPRRSVEEAITLLGRQRVIGIVLNGMEGLDRYYSGYGYYYR